MKKILCFVSFLTFSLAFSQHHEWGYEGGKSPEHWGELEEGGQCGNGKYQSPININSSNAKLDKKIAKLVFNYGSGEIKDIINNGHTIQFDFQEGSNVIYNGKKYYLAQFHAHEGSEHTIDKIQYPLELHFVHKADDGAILVIGVMVKEGAENSYFEKLNIFKDLKEEGKIDTKIVFNPGSIYPKDKNYYHYIGSLTTPPCSENVSWFVFKTPITMTAEEIDEIGDYLPKHNNRPIQALNGREVITSK